jgi:surface carbohydrate biosynthesis protein
MRILILVDHKWRDLPGHVLIQSLAERRGHQVAFVRNGFHWDAAWASRPDVLVINHLLEASAVIEARRLADVGVATVVLPTEGIPTLQGTRDLHAGAGQDYSGVARFCVWNEAMRERMLAHRVLPAEHVPVIGVPRFDFYQPPFSSVLPDREAACRRFGLDPAKSVVLWATNFAQAAVWERDPAFSQRDWNKLGLDKVLGDCGAFARGDLACREGSFAAIRTVLERRPDWQLLLKLHPSENAAWFRSMVQTLPAGRVALVDAAYIWEVLPAADVLVKRSCTTGVEAWMRGQPTIELQPLPQPIYFSAEHASGSVLATDADSLERHIAAVLAGVAESGEILAARQAFIARWCHRADGRSTERFLDVLEGLDAERRTGEAKPRGEVPRRPLVRRLRYRLLTACDHFLHDRRLYGWRGRVDRLGRMDKWYRHADAAAWQKRLASCMPVQRS